MSHMKYAETEHIDTQRSIVVPGAEGGGWELLVNRDTVPILQNARVLELICTAVRMYLTLLKWTLRND